MPKNIVFPVNDFHTDEAFTGYHKGVDVNLDQVDRDLMHHIIPLEPTTVKPTGRLEANREIIKLLAQAVEDNPDQRFWQLLFNLGIVNTVTVGTGINQMQMVQDDYQKESKMILMMMKQRLRK